MISSLSRSEVNIGSKSLWTDAPPAKLTVRFASTYSDLNKLMEGLNFTLADRYGQLLTLIFVAMVFSSGIPFMVRHVSVMCIVFCQLSLRTERLRRKPYVGIQRCTGALLLKGALPFAVV